MGDLEHSLNEWTVGCQVALQTTLGEDLSGEVFCFDRNTNCLVLKQPGSSPGAATIKIVKANYIKTVLSATPPAEHQELRLPPVNPQRGIDREARALQQAEAEAARLGVGVNREAQQLFDALSRTLPCSWQGKTIVVMDEVVVPEPYDPSSVAPKSQDTSESRVDRVRKVVEAERRRLGFS